MGSEAAYGSEWQLQRRYDIAYQQCMYAKGNTIPSVVRRQRQAYVPPPPPPGTSSGAWVTVPGQYVDGKWVPAHRVQVASGSRRQAAPPEPPASQPGLYAPSPLDDLGVVVSA